MRGEGGGVREEGERGEIRCIGGGMRDEKGEVKGRDKLCGRDDG